MKVPLSFDYFFTTLSRFTGIIWYSMPDCCLSGVMAAVSTIYAARSQSGFSNRRSLIILGLDPSVCKHRALTPQKRYLEELHLHLIEDHSCVSDAARYNALSHKRLVDPAVCPHVRIVHFRKPKSCPQPSIVARWLKKRVSSEGSIRPAADIAVSML